VVCRSWEVKWTSILNEYANVSPHSIWYAIIDCLEDKREGYQNCCVCACVPMQLWTVITGGLGPVLGCIFKCCARFFFAGDSLCISIIFCSPMCSLHAFSCLFWVWESVAVHDCRVQYNIMCWWGNTKLCSLAVQVCLDVCWNSKISFS